LVDGLIVASASPHMVNYSLKGCGQVTRTIYISVGTKHFSARYITHKLTGCFQNHMTF